jgi:DNA-binding HxlR family transcriptional regulator
MSRRSYDQYCAVARALDLVGERWTLLIVRELLAGPRRYTDLHADLPGVSTDVLASRLREMEAGGLLTRRRLPPPGAAFVYELTPRGRDLRETLTVLAAWGAGELGERRPTDALRAHWTAVPLMDQLSRLVAPRTGTVDVQADEGVFHVRIDDSGPAYAHGPAERPDARLVPETGFTLGPGAFSLRDMIKEGRIAVRGDGPLADALRGS